MDARIDAGGQAATLEAEVRALYPDDEPLQREVLEAVARYRCGELTLEDIGAALAQARRADAVARAVARQVGVLAVANQEKETQVAAKLGVDRMALRGWLGKRKR